MALRREGESILSFSVGEPDFPPERWPQCNILCATCTGNMLHAAYSIKCSMQRTPHDMPRAVAPSVRAVIASSVASLSVLAHLELFAVPRRSTASHCSVGRNGTLSPPEVIEATRLAAVEGHTRYVTSFGLAML